MEYLHNGSPQSDEFICFLNHNVFYEKAVIFIWFWLAFIFILTVAWIIFLVCGFSSQKGRFYQLKIEVICLIIPQNKSWVLLTISRNSLHRSLLYQGLSVCQSYMLTQPTHLFKHIK